MVRRATTADLSAIAAIDRAAFSGNQAAGAAEHWYAAQLARGDQYQLFVFEKSGQIVSYIGWELQGGFARTIPVIELQKLATHPDFRGQRIGTQLVKESFASLKRWLKETQPEATQLYVAVWVTQHNETAQKVYRTICNEGVLGERNMYGAGKAEFMLRGRHEI